jgi:F420-0:gamma-glutamyl ligase
LHPQSVNSISATAIRAPIFTKGADLTQYILDCFPKSEIREGLILAVTSKIVSLSENRVTRVGTKKDLARSEAEVYLGEVGYGSSLTITKGLLMLGAGIDESNSAEGEFILYPTDPFASAARLGHALRTAWRVKKLGVILTDSMTAPLRRGVRGVALSHFGFHGVRNKIGNEDLFGRKLRTTRVNLVDGLAGLAVLLMGEGNESQPLVAIQNAEVDFCADVDPKEIQVSLDDDIFAPLLKAFTKISD